MLPNDWRRKNNFTVSKRMIFWEHNLNVCNTSFFPRTAVFILINIQAINYGVFQYLLLNLFVFVIEKASQSDEQAQYSSEPKTLSGDNYTFHYWPDLPGYMFIVLAEVWIVNILRGTYIYLFIHLFKTISYTKFLSVSCTRTNIRWTCFPHAKNESKSRWTRTLNVDRFKYYC